MRNYGVRTRLRRPAMMLQVVTNAREVRPPFRMHMRAEDWQRCEASTVLARSRCTGRIPSTARNPIFRWPARFVSKLAGIAMQLHAKDPFDLILSFYLEPYAVAGHLLSQMTGVPHVVRMAGSDAGRLWHHPQLEALYDHVLRSAEIVIAGRLRSAQRAVQRGIDADRVAFGGGFIVPDDLFAPDGPVIDFAAMRMEIESDPICAICGGASSNRANRISACAASSAKAKAPSRCLPPCTGSSATAWMSGWSHSRMASRRSKKASGPRASKLGLADRNLADTVSSPLARSGISARNAWRCAASSRIF